MFKLKFIVWFLSLVAVASVNAGTGSLPDLGADQVFKLKFELNKPLIYSVERKTRTVNDISGGGRSSITRNSLELRFKFKLTPVTVNGDGTIKVLYEPFDVEQDIEIIGPSGQINTATRRLDILTKQNGVTIIDTKKSIGLAQAKNSKAALYPLLLCGYFSFEPVGDVKKIGGDLPFIDVWRDNLKYMNGFFGAIFSTNPVQTQGSWTNYLTLNNLGGFISDDGIVLTNVYVRNIDPGASNLVSFTLYESDHYSNLNGYTEQGGQRSSIAISEFTTSKNAAYTFDQKLGRIITCKSDEKTETTGSMMSQGTSVTGHNSVETESVVTLIPP